MARAAAPHALRQAHSGRAGGCLTAAPARILYLIPSLDAGGAERSLLELLRRIDRRRFEPTICTFHPGGELRAEFEQTGTPIIALDGLGRHELRGVFLPRVLARVRPQIIHSRLVLPNLWARTLGRLFGSRVITEERSTGSGRQGWVARANQLTGRLSDVEVANSEGVAEFMRTKGGVPENRLRIVPGGVDTVRFSPGGASREVDVVSVGRIEPYKGIDEFLGAIEAVLEQRPETKVVLAGVGSRLNEARDFVARRNLNNVTIAGAVSDVPSLLRRSRVFVTASHDEGLPNAVMEAMSCGLPVVATDIPGHRALVLPEQTGALVPVRDPEPMSREILRYLSEPERAEAHGRAGRERIVSDYSFERVAREYEALYESLLS